MKMIFLIVLLSFSAFSIAGADELLVNGGFEDGDLTGWLQGTGEGHVVAESAVGTPTCERIDPPTPRTGSYLFSSAADDGAIPGTVQISLKQEIDVSGFSYIATGNAFVSGSAYVSGAPGCADPSDDLVEIVMVFFQGGADGTYLDDIGSGLLDPEPGEWRELTLARTQVPEDTDTIVFFYNTWLDEGFTSIDIGADDISLTIEEDDTPVEKSSWGEVRALFR